jgi:hypothetical protein
MLTTDGDHIVDRTAMTAFIFSFQYTFFVVLNSLVTKNKK